MTLSKFLTSAAVAALLSGAAVAQENSTDSATGMGTDSTGMATDSTGMTDTGTGYADAAAEAPQSLEEMTVGQVVGRSVVDPEGNTIGEIDYVVEQPEGVAGVIGIGGFLGLGEYTVAIQMDEFEYAPEEATFMLNTDKETLKERPEFDESNVEGLPDDTQMASVLPTEDETSAEGSSDMSGSADAASGDSEADTGSEDAAAADTGASDAMSEDDAAADTGAADTATEEEGASAEEPAADPEQDAAAGDASDAAEDEATAAEPVEEDTDADQS